MASIILLFRVNLVLLSHYNYAMYVLDLKKNLVLVTMLEDRGYNVIFSKGKDFFCHIVSRHVKRIEVRVKNLLDVEDYVALSTKAEKVQDQDIYELWHRRLGYLHHKALNITQQIYTRLPKGALEQRDTCKGCTLGKYTKVTFHYSDNRVQEILERVHSYVCGPFSTTSKIKHMYYVIFVDDFSHKCWILFM